MRKLTKDQFVEKANKVHKRKYKYDHVDYKGNNENVLIECPEHGLFSQTPGNHLAGHGCPKCSESHLEREVRLYLEENNIVYIYEHTWEWLRFERKQTVDFYLPAFSIAAIECQGIQHFNEVKFFSRSIDYTLSRDINKEKLCIEHNIPLYYYSNIIRNKLISSEFQYPYKVFENMSELMNFINLSD